MSAPRLQLAEVRLFERQVQFRMPFRFGSVSTTQSPQLYARVRIALEDGREGWGAASQLLGARWFDKSSELTAEQNYADLRKSVAMTAEAYLSEKVAHTAFGLHAANYAALLDAARRAGMKPLVAGYGPALIDLAILDALCRASSVSAFEGMSRNIGGIEPGLLLTDFAGFDFSSFLRKLKPRLSVHVRHTVGLADAIDSADLPAACRIGDGLPETLAEVLTVEAPTFFKIKLSGDAGEDLERLKRIAALLDAASRPYHATFDGNEQFQSADQFRSFWNRCALDPVLTNMVARTLFIEQPISRENALSESVSGMAGRLPVIIDESDDELDAFPRARAVGYGGVSSKSCKGIFKSLINRARCQRWSAENPDRPLLMSAEDLTTQPGVSLQQDLVLAGILGMTHVERNAHHYVKGMSAAPPAEQSRFARRHPDLYEEASDGTRLRIRDGVLCFESLRCRGFGVDCDPDWNSMKESGHYTMSVDAPQETVR